MGLLKRIESFIARLELYIKIPPTPEMINVVTEIMAEILFAFVLVNEQTQQGRFSKLIPPIITHEASLRDY